MERRIVITPSRLLAWRNVLGASLGHFSACSGDPPSGLDQSTALGEGSGGGDAGRSPSGAGGSAGFGGTVCLNAAACGFGRPFIVAGEPRVAGTMRRDDWSRRLTLASVMADDARRAGRHWERMAELEHASIASFARFALELLAFGAPAELVREAALAMADETRHAELCFGVASAYAGHPVGPRALATADAAPRVTLRDAVLDAVLEGCIGETVSAIEASETLEHVADPALREVLTAIASDERRHAELAFRFVRWALEREPSLREPVLSLARREVELACAELYAGSPDERRLLALGVYPERFRPSLRHVVVREVIVPCLTALAASDFTFRSSARAEA